MAEAVDVLKAELARTGTNVPAGEDPVVCSPTAWCLAFGADLTSLEQLLADVGVSHASCESASRA